MTTSQTREWRLGSLSPSKDGKNYVLPAQDFPAPERICNAASRAPFVPNDRTVYRPGALNFMECRSRGTGC